MASVSVSHLVLFIASLVIAAGVAGTFTQSVSRISAGIEDQSLDVSEEVRTDIEIISDSGSSVYDGTNVTLYVKNTGTSQLVADPTSVDVILDGQYRTQVSLTVVDGSSWDSSNVVRLDIEASLPSGDHRVKIIVNGDEEVFTFRT
ncbi:MAG: flagellar protein G [Haloferacaceae archaeon]